MGYILLLLMALVSFGSAQEFELKTYCVPEDDCWPSSSDFDTFIADNPNMEVVQRGDDGWTRASDLVLNRRVSEAPGVAMFASSKEDVIAAVKFSVEHNMNLKVISSGHEFIGRNSHPGSLQLSVREMRDISTDLSCSEHAPGCMTVGPGVYWIEAYKAANAVDRIIMGGEERTVSVTGWALGGGHSPVSRKLGLGVDNIVEMEMVTADLSVVVMNDNGITTTLDNGTVVSSDDTDLWWAVRGGGGNTFGVVTQLIYKLHEQPAKFTSIDCTLGGAEKGYKTMKEMRLAMRDVEMDLPDEFGGYILTGATCYTTIPSCKMAVYATYAFTHWGSESDNQEWFDKIRSAAEGSPHSQGRCNVEEFDSFYDYTAGKPNVTYGDHDMYGVFVSPDEYSEDFIDKEAKVYGNAFGATRPITATYIRLGGQTKNTSSGATAINPLFRNAMYTIAFGGVKGPIKKYNKMLDKMITKRGQYFSECDDDLLPGVWQEQFWGDSYPRLLEIKRKYDPDNHFTCKQCVGSDGSTLLPTVLIMIVASLLVYHH